MKGFVQLMVLPTTEDVQQQHIPVLNIFAHELASFSLLLKTSFQFSLTNAETILC